MGKGKKNSGPPQDLDSPVKLLFGLYQCLHHLSILTGDANTDKRPVFSRKVEELDRFFIPAMPTLNPLFQKQCHATNEKWRQEQMGNLTEHYQWCIETLKGSISACRLTQSDLKTYLAQARKWAQQHFRKRFQIKAFDKVDQMVLNFAISETTASGPTPGSSTQIEEQPKKVTVPEVTVPEVISTPSRKRDRPLTPESSPTQIQTPKKTKSSSYAEKAKSPLIRPNASTQKDNPAVEKLPRLPKDQRGSNMHKFWKIPKVTKDILVLGTSNLARISYVGRRDAQVVSFPGLKLDLLLKLINAFQFGTDSPSPGQQPSHVILSVGINDRDLSASTNEINLKKVVQAAKRQFPDSKISLYQQPFDPSLSEKQRKTLTSLNDAIEKQCQSHGLNCIPRVAKSKFATAGGNDLIHWTENCANATMEHLFQSLN